jgi:hypothetical protein
MPSVAKIYVKLFGKDDTVSYTKPTGSSINYRLGWDLVIWKFLHKLYSHFVHTMYLCVPYGSHNKQRLFP